MIEIKFDDEELKELCLIEIEKKLDKVIFESILIDTKQLCSMLSLSRPTVEKVFLSDPNFPSIRIGKKWVFNREEVQEYIKKWCVEKRKKKRRLI